MDSLKSRFEKFEQDHELAERVYAELQYDPSIAGASRVDVSAAGGVVMLQGRVDSLAQHWAMERAASRVAGVKGVINGLIVLPPKSQSRRDDQIAEAVAMVLAWTADLPDGISSSVLNGCVTLEGTVAFRHQKQAAEITVRRLVGVRGVDNRLKVATGEVVQDIKVAIDSAIRRRSDHAVEIDVEYDAGTVTLRGRAHSWAERRDAEESARLAPGVSEVVDEVTVQP
jgi:osmotically-inducible protein OsmY